MMMTKVTTRLETDLIVVTEECHLEIEIEEEVDSYKLMDRIKDRIIERDCKIGIERTLGVEIIGRCKVTELRIMEVDVETIRDTYRDNYRDDYRNDNFRRGRSRSRERQYSCNPRKDDRRSSRSTSKSRSSSRSSS